MSITLVAVIAVAWFALVFVTLGFFRVAKRPAPVPPARPRQRRVQIDLDDIEWDWRREETV